MGIQGSHPIRYIQRSGLPSLPTNGGLLLVQRSSGEKLSKKQLHPWGLSLRQLAIITGFLSLLCLAAGLSYLLVAVRGISTRQQAAPLGNDDVVKAELVDRVDLIISRLGRLPDNENELEILMGYRLPSIHDGQRKVGIRYKKMDEDRYLLHYELWATDDWVYDSSKPESGWVQHYY